MENNNFQLILVEPNGNFAIPDIELSDAFETDFNIENAADISKRKDSIAKNITFPGTKNNNRIFNNLYSFNRHSDTSLEEVLYANYSPSKGVRAVLYENNYPLITGELKINEINRNYDTGAYTYSGVITGNLVTFFGKIKDLMLTDLEGFSEEFTYSWDNITSSWAYDVADRFLYPQIDYGNGVYPDNTRFDIRGFKPAIYTREYIRAILASQGYSYSSVFIDQEIFGRSFIPHSNKEFGTTIFGNFATAATAAKSTSLSDVGLHWATPVSFGAFTAQPYITKNANKAFTFKRADGEADLVIHGDSFTFNKSAQTAFSFNMDINMGVPGGIWDAYIAIVKVAGDVISWGQSPAIAPNWENILVMQKLADDAHDVVNFNVTLSVPFGYYDKDSEYAFVFYTSHVDDETVNQLGSLASFGNPDATTGSVFDYEFGDDFPLSDALPKLTGAADMLRSIFKFFNLYAIENPENIKELIIEPYDVFYQQFNEPAAYAFDWSKKIDNKTVKMKINTTLPKSYLFKFKEDSDFYNTLYKNSYSDTYGNYTAINSNGSADAKPVEVTFSTTIIVQENGDDKIMPAIFTGDLLNKKTMKSNIRILFNNDLAVCNAYDVVLVATDGTVIEVLEPGVSLYQRSHHTLTIFGQDVFSLLFGIPRAVYYPVSGSIFDMPTLFKSLYQRQLIELNSENIFTIECLADLNEIDIANLDLRRPIFINAVQGNSYFKVMQATYYNRFDPSRLTLQKVIL